MHLVYLCESYNHMQEFRNLYHASHLGLKGEFLSGPGLDLI